MEIDFFLPMLYTVVVFVGIYNIFQLKKKSNGDDLSISNAISLLDSRYIQGVLSDEEYEKMKDILNSSK